jgi:hypothetical protein
MHPIISRPIQGDADFRKMRDLLSATVPITPVGFNWDVRRLDGKRFYDQDAAADRFFQRPVQSWEDGDVLAGFVLPEGSGDAHLQVHPDYRHLEGEMIAWAEESLAVPAEGGARRQLDIYVNEYDVLRQRLLSDVHAPAKWRVLGPMSNIPEFYKAFGVKPGQPMWRAPSERVRIW